SSDMMTGSFSVTTARFVQDNRRAFSSFPPGFAFTMTRRTRAEASHHGTRLHRWCLDTATWPPSSWTVSVSWLARGRIAHTVVVIAAAIDGHHVQGRQVRCREGRCPGSGSRGILCGHDREKGPAVVHGRADI